MQFAYQFPERLDRLVLVDSGGLGEEVSIALRAATLPGSELVLPLLFSPVTRTAGRFAAGCSDASACGPGRTCAGSPRAWTR